MKRILLAALAAVSLNACSNQTDSVNGSGGKTGSGGSSASGGSSVTGGSSATGGASATGGTSAKGGSSATGGSSVTGGSSENGGTSATGGRTGAGGSTATGGGTSSAGNTAGGGTAGTFTGGSTSQGGATATGGRTGSGGFSGAGGAGPADGGLPDANGQLDGERDVVSPRDLASEGARDSISTGDAASYQPCPSGGNPCKILPLGDSITWGVGDEGNAGYRGPLFALAVAAQQNMTFTGSQSNGPTTVSGKTFPQKNEGHSGWTISQIAGRIPSPAYDSGSGGSPNIVLLMIGTNDVYAASGQAEMANRLESLLDKIISGAPDALVVVAKITPLTIGGGYTSVIKPYNDAIPGLVQKKVSAGKHVVLGDMNTNFTTSTMLGTDGIHPNQAGYKFMANQWYSVIGNLLPK